MGKRKPSYDELLKIIARLERENAKLRALNAKLERKAAKQEAEMAKLLKRLEAAERASKRQAAALRKTERKAGEKRSKRPGRKSGKGKWCTRQRPERVDEVLEAPLPEACPDCGGGVQKERTAEQFQLELPPIEPVVRKFETAIGKCTCCGKRIQGRHELQSSDALGAAAVQIGPNAPGLAALLNKQCGCSWGRIANLFGRVFSLEVTAARCAERPSSASVPERTRSARG